MLQFYSIGSLKQRLELVKEYLDQKKKDFSQSAQSDKRRMKQLSDAVNLKIA